MRYDVIVLGATFTAAGISTVLADRCLILESRPQAGYEFLNALSFGANYSTPPKTPQAKALEAEFHKRGVFLGEHPNLFPTAPALYQLLAEHPVLLNAHIISVDKEQDHFRVVTHSVSGYRSFQAKTVIDTRTHPQHVQSRRLNMLITCPPGQIPQLAPSIHLYALPTSGDYILCYPIAADCNMLEARTVLADFIRTLPENCKVSIVADCFDDTLSSPSYPESKILSLPSKQFANPILAYDAGVLFAEGGT